MTDKPDIDKEIKLKELEIKVLEIRLKEAELRRSEGVLKKLFNPLFASVLVAVIGGVISILSIKSESKAQIELEKIKHEHSLYKEAFDLGDLTRAQELISFYIAIGQLQPNNKINLGPTGAVAVENNDPESRADSNKTVTTDQPLLQKKLDIPVQQKADETSLLEKARHYENQAIDALENGNTDQARENFRKAEATYPTLHYNYEIYTLMLKHPQLSAQKVKDSIRLRYSWGLSAENRKRLE